MTFGEKVHASKSRILFSQNVHQKEISDILEQEILGKYLGMPLHHKKVSKAAYQLTMV